jgi:hypothetical protein
MLPRSALSPLFDPNPHVALPLALVKQPPAPVKLPRPFPEDPRPFAFRLRYAGLLDRLWLLLFACRKTPMSGVSN